MEARRLVGDPLKSGAVDECPHHLARAQGCSTAYDDDDVHRAGGQEGTQNGHVEEFLPSPARPLRFSRAR